MAAASASNAWAVGITPPSGGPVKALILRWDGKAWTRISGPHPEAYGSLKA